MNWYVVRSKSNCERTVADMLAAKGYEQLCPIYRSKRGDAKNAIKPLFPGYLFCRFDPNDRLPVLIVPGVVHILAFGGVLAPVPQHEVDAIAAIVRSGLPAKPHPYQLGDLVTVESGPLAGLSGTILRIKDEWRLVVSVSMLQQSVAAELDIAWIKGVHRNSHGVSPGVSPVLQAA